MAAAAAEAAQKLAEGGADAATPATLDAGTSTTDANAAPAEVKLAPSLYYASAPRCKSVAAIPAGAEKLGADGFVGLELNINQAGVVQRGEIHRSSGFADLDAAALKQVTENLTFKPCQKGTVIVGCKQYIKFRWKTI
jgi:TonB family protein